MEFGVEERWNEVRKGGCKFRNYEREEVTHRIEKHIETLDSTK